MFNPPTPFSFMEIVGSFSPYYSVNHNNILIFINQERKYELSVTLLSPWLVSILNNFDDKVNIYFNVTYL